MTEAPAEPTDVESKTSDRQVIARIHPISLGVVIFFLSIPVVVFVGQLNSAGWLNPQAFASERHSKYAALLSIPYFGQVFTIAGLGLLLLLVCQFAFLATRRFGDVVLEDGRLSYASRPWLGKLPSASVAAIRWVTPQVENKLTKGGKDIEILHIKRAHGETSRRTVILRPWFYRESPEQIAANLEACGFRFSAEPNLEELPIWERRGAEEDH